MAFGMWKIYQKYPFTSFLGYFISILFIIMGFLSALPLHLVPPIVSLLNITEDIERWGMCMVMIGIVIFSYSIMMSSSDMYLPLNFGLFTIIAVLGGISIGFIIRSGINHILLTYNIKGVKYNDVFILSLVAIVIVLTVLIVNLYLRRYNTQKGEKKSNLSTEKATYFKGLIILIGFIFFVILIFLVSQTPFALLIPLQSQKIGGILIFLYFIFKTLKNPEALILSDAYFISFLVVSYSGIPLYTYSARGTQIGNTKKDPINFSAFLSAMQDFSRVTFGESAFVRSLYTEAGFMSVYRDSISKCYFCLLTTTGNPIISKSIIALRNRFVMRYGQEILQHNVNNFSNLNQFKDFDVVVDDFTRFFLI